MSKTNNLVFTLVQIVSWIIFVGLCIQAGALLVNFILSLFKPEVVHNLYQKLDLNEMYVRSKAAYFGICSFILIIAILKAILFYVVIKLVTKINLEKPFNIHVSQQITLMSYYTLAIGLTSYMGRQIANYLEHRNYAVDHLNKFWADSQAFVIMAAVVYVIAIIFKRGVEIQNENDLTV